MSPCCHIFTATPVICRLGGWIPDISDQANVTAAKTFYEKWIDSGELDSGRKVIVDAKTSSMFGFILQLLPNLIWNILILNVKSK